MTYGIMQQQESERLELIKETIVDLTEQAASARGRITSICEEIPTFRAANAPAGHPKRAG